MNKFATLTLATLALSIAATPALAEKAAAVPTSAVEIKPKERLFDVSGATVARVSRVASNGDILVIYKGQVRRIDASTLSKDDGKLTTTMSRLEIRRMR